MRNIDPSLLALLAEVHKAYVAIPERFRWEASIDVLTRVVARIVPGVTAVNGQLHDQEEHSWLITESPDRHVIDIFPRYHYPGPLLVDTYLIRNAGWYVPSSKQTKSGDRMFASHVEEIADATEGAKRFLGMP